MTSKKQNYESTNPVFTCFCYVFWAVLPEVELSILTKKDILQHIKICENRICRFVVWFIWCHEHITDLSSNMSFSLLGLGKECFYNILRANNSDESEPSWRIFSSAKLKCPSSAWLSLTRLDSAWLGLTRLDSAWLGL